MEENGQLVQFIFNTNREVVSEKENEWTIYIRGSEILASSSDYAKTYYHYANDEMGSCTHIVDDREILNQYEYDAWGNVVSQKETVKNRFKFNGQQLDPITQQYYLRARFYNPVVARFTQEDTYRGDGLNLYAYCQNNPTHYVDPSGNACKPTKKTLEEALDQNASTKKLLKGEGDIGTYKDLIKKGNGGDNITPHHMPSKKYMSSKGVSENDGLCMNVEMPSPGTGGRHRRTDTYGRNMTNSQKEYYYSLSPRDALAYDLKNLKQIYMDDGLYKEIKPQLKKYIEEYIKYRPDIFGK